MNKLVHSALGACCHLLRGLVHSDNFIVAVRSQERSPTELITLEHLAVHRLLRDKLGEEEEEEAEPNLGLEQCDGQDCDSVGSSYKIENRVGFMFAGTDIDEEDGTNSAVSDSRARIRTFASIALRHPSLMLRIDSHCGMTAPRTIARSYSMRRAAKASRAPEHPHTMSAFV